MQNRRDGIWISIIVAAALGMVMVALYEAGDDDAAIPTFTAENNSHGLGDCVGERIASSSSPVGRMTPTPETDSCTPLRKRDTEEQHSARLSEMCASGGDEVPFRADAAGGDADSGRVPETLTVDNSLDVLRNGTIEDRARLRKRLREAGDVRLLTKLMQEGGNQAEPLAFAVLLGMDDSEGVIAALGHLLTRESTDSRWEALARQFGEFVDARHVDLMVTLLSKTTPEGQARLVALLPFLNGEEALYQLLYSAGEWEADWLHNLTLNTVFSSGKSGSTTLMKDFLVAHQDLEIKALAADGLSRIGTDASVRFLAQAGVMHPRIEPMCLAALENVASGYAQETLLGMVSGAQYPVAYRVAAVHALEQMPASDYVASQLGTLSVTVSDNRVAAEAKRVHDGLDSVILRDSGFSTGSQRDEEVWF